MIRKPILAVAAVLIAVLVLAQLVPYRVHNPPVTQEPIWDSPETEALARRACFDCHSNEVEVPWYGYIAPTSWVVNHHVLEGREYLNFSEMDRPQHEAHEAGKTVEEGEMPPRYYTALHGAARLSAEEARALAKGLDLTLGSEEYADHDD